MTLTDYPTFSNSPFFYDPRNPVLPEPEQGHIRVSLTRAADKVIY